MNNLSPEILAWLQSQGINPGTMTNGGSTYHQNLMGGDGGVEQGQNPFQVQGYLQDVQAGQNNPGDMQYVYGKDGGYQATGAVPKQSLIPMEILAPLLAAAGGMAAFGGTGAFGGAGAGAGGAAGGIQTLPALELMSTAGMESLPMYQMGGMGAAGAGAGGMSGMGGGMGEMSGLQLSTSGPNLAGNMLPSGLGASALGGFGSSMNGLLGPAATAAGALAGAQGQQNEQSATREVPAWIKQHYDNGQGGGLLPMGMGLLQQQNSPERMAQWNRLFSTGAGLLGIQPRTGNLSGVR